MVFGHGLKRETIDKIFSGNEKPKTNYPQPNPQPRSKTMTFAT
jgi:hypothetical protein